MIAVTAPGVATTSFQGSTGQKRLALVLEAGQSVAVAVGQDIRTGIIITTQDLTAVARARHGQAAVAAGLLPTPMALTEQIPGLTDLPATIGLHNVTLGGFHSYTGLSQA